MYLTSTPLAGSVATHGVAAPSNVTGAITPHDPNSPAAGLTAPGAVFPSAIVRNDANTASTLEVTFTLISAAGGIAGVCASMCFITLQYLTRVTLLSPCSGVCATLYLQCYFTPVFAPCICAIYRAILPSYSPPATARVRLCMYCTPSPPPAASATSAAQSVPAHGNATFRVPSLPVPIAELWSVPRPYLYTLRTTVAVGGGGAVLDTINASIGIRAAVWDANRGFFLNGEHVKMRGCVRVPNMYTVRLDKMCAEQCLRACSSNVYVHLSFLPHARFTTVELGLRAPFTLRCLGLNDAPVRTIHSSHAPISHTHPFLACFPSLSGPATTRTSAPSAALCPPVWTCCAFSSCAASAGMHGEYVVYLLVYCAQHTSQESARVCRSPSTAKRLAHHVANLLLQLESHPPPSSFSLCCERVVDARSFMALEL